MKETFLLMNTIFKIVFILIISILSSCGNTNVKYKAETVLFNNYLEKVPSIMKNQDANYLFLIVTSSACPGCATSLEEDFKSKSRFKNCYLISSEKTSDNVLIKNKNFIYDKNKIIDRLNLYITNVGVILYSKSKIVEIAELNPDNLNIIENLISKYSIQ